MLVHIRWYFERPKTAKHQDKYTAEPGTKIKLRTKHILIKINSIIQINNVNEKYSEYC